MKHPIYTVLFGTALSTLLFCSCSHEQKYQENTQVVTSYALYNVHEQQLVSQVRLPAQFDAFEEVAIYPRISGYVENLSVDIGSSVQKGQILMRLSAPELEQNVISAHEKFLKSQASYTASRESYLRIQKASQTPGAVSVNDLQMAQLRMQADSATANSERAAWQSMESMKNYEVVRAPFSGMITQRNIDVGALVIVGTKNDAKPMLQLQQISKLRLKLSVPENYATQLSNNDTVQFRVDALPGHQFHGCISRQAHSLDPKFRSENVEVDVENKDQTLMPGMYAEVLIPINGHTNACVVPQSSVLSTTEKKFVIKVVDHHARQIEVITGAENNGMIEAFGSLQRGDFILAKASEDVHEGDIVH